MDKQQESFLIQTSKDYDMDIDIVKDLYNIDPNKLYKNLEKYLELKKHTVVSNILNCRDCSCINIIQPCEACSKNKRRYF